MKIQIDTKHFNAVLAAAADKTDSRYYLRSFFIDLNAERVVSTDGVRLVTVPYAVIEAQPAMGDNNHSGSKDLNGYLYHAVKRLRVAIETVEIDTAVGTLTGITKKRDRDESIALEVVDGRFPSYPSVIPAFKTEPVERIGFNPRLLADIDKALNGKDERHVVVEFPSGNTGVMRVNWVGHDDVECIIMPCRC